MTPVLIGRNALTVLTAAARSSLMLRQSVVGDPSKWGTRRADDLAVIQTENDAIAKAIQLAEDALGKKEAA